MAAYDLEEQEIPLDPAAERLRRKLARLLLVSGAIMVLGFIAVFGAIVYRLSDEGEADPAVAAAAAGPAVEAQLPIPAGSRLVAADLDGARALLTLQAADGSASLLLVELPSGRAVGRYALQPQ